VPADVPKGMRKEYEDNYMKITRNSGRLMLFAGDQKIEHLNDDFYGKDIHIDDADPEHLFRVANSANIGVLATQRGLIARYGPDYRDVQYLVKLNSKTNLIETEQKDPLSGKITDVNEVIELKKISGLKILAVGYTVYLGSEFEAEMIRDASRMVYEAHKSGLLTVLWVYPRGKAVKDEKDAHLIAGATGVAACLGSDFVKVNPPKKDGEYAIKELKEAVLSAGRTKVVCAGGSSVDVNSFLQRLYDQIQIGVSGNATGRNIHQKSFKEAKAMCNAIYAITVEGKNAKEAFNIYKKQI
jgi:fructose-bisphosphate aldolase/6-deoxy-5-ketofructose 1-phosphate synthase